MELQQSPLYQKYIRLLGWNIIEVGGTAVFMRHFPFIGTLAKLQRPAGLPDAAKTITELKKHQVRRLALEPSLSQDVKELRTWCDSVAGHVCLCRTPFLPTKTILIDLTPTEEKIFGCFAEAKRRAVRRARKNNLAITESSDIDKLIQVKNRSAGFLGFITTSGLRQLWQTFAPDHATVLLAQTSDKKLIAGVLLLFWETTAYYWIAGASAEGKKLAAPTLLVWEGLKRSKQQGMKQFDFVGVWDERTPRQNREWHGFTRFKEGFGGKVAYYPIARLRR